MNRVFRPAYDMPRIYLYRAPVDFRTSFRGPAAIVEQEIGHDPCGRGLYAFTSRQRNKIKCLFCEDNGFVLYYKSLAEEKFRWPSPGDEVMPLTGEQINWLLNGYDIGLMHPFAAFALIESLRGATGDQAHGCRDLVPALVLHEQMVMVRSNDAIEHLQAVASACLAQPVPPGEAVALKLQ